MENNNSVLLEMKNICKSFPGVKALDNVSLTVKRGTVHALMGENGAGKSTLFLNLNGVLQPSAGEILLDGAELLHADRTLLRQVQGREIGVVFQEPQSCMDPLMRIGPQVEEVLRIHTDLSREARRDQALAALAAVELPDPAGVYRKYPHELSGGMLQRAMIAAAVVARPKLLLLDEPTTALDVTIQAQILELLKKLNRESGISMLFISHNLNVVRKLCTRTAVMQRGVLVEEGDIETVFRHPRHPYTQRLIAAIPEALAVTDLVCSSVNVGSTKAGINMDAAFKMAGVIKRAAELTADKQCIGAGKLVVFCNAVEDNPFMAGAFHGSGEADEVVNVGVSGPGVVRAVLADLPKEADITTVAEAIKATAFKITRAGELMAREASRRLGVQQGILDLSLAPTPAEGDSVAEILEAIGVGQCGGPGTTAALAMLNDAVKKGGVMASSSVGGLSGAFIPVSEDAGMIRAAEDGALSIEKLEAMTCVCSVGLDMIAVPGDTTQEAIFGIIADECAIGMINNKTTAVRLIPAIGCQVGDQLDFGGLLGYAPVMPVNPYAGTVFAHRGGRMPAPLNSLKN